MRRKNVKMLRRGRVCEHGCQLYPYHHEWIALPEDSVCPRCGCKVGR